MSKFEPARVAGRRLACLSTDDINNVLFQLADRLNASHDLLLEANARDLERMDPANPRRDRLMLTPERIDAIAADTRNVASLPSPLGRVLDTTERPSGLTIVRVTVPFGVIGVIYEARPNVTFDVFALCFKAGSAVVLRGGSEAAATNEAAISIIHKVLEDNDLPTALAMPLTGDHEASLEMLQAVGDIDLIIPRGSRRLIDFVRDNARVPVIETGAGVCHTYLHSSGRLDYAIAIVDNAKTRRVSVCNALDTLLINSDRLGDLPVIAAPLSAKDVDIYADDRAFAALDGHYPAERLHHATADDLGREWLDYKMTVVTVDSLDAAIAHIDRYGSHHSEAIVAEDAKVVADFLRRVDAACVYANVSTAFTDGAQFGFGAEIGISTQKLHARGPMALRELTTYKYLITGHGATRHP